MARITGNGQPISAYPTTPGDNQGADNNAPKVQTTITNPLHEQFPAAKKRSSVVATMDRVSPRYSLAMMEKNIGSLPKLHNPTPDSDSE
jgi:hypothetical protein